MEIEAIISVTDERQAGYVYKTLVNLSAIDIKAVVMHSVYVNYSANYSRILNKVNLISVASSHYMACFDAGVQYLNRSSYVLLLKAGEIPDPVRLLRFMLRYENSPFKAALFPSGINSRERREKADNTPLITSYDYLYDSLMNYYLPDRAAVFNAGTNTVFSRWRARLTGKKIKATQAITYAQRGLLSS